MSGSVSRENRQRALDELLVLAGRDADVVDVERDRPHALVGVRLHLPLGFEHGDGPIAEVVVERFERAVDDPLAFRSTAAPATGWPRTRGR